MHNKDHVYRAWGRGGGLLHSCESAWPCLLYDKTPAESGEERGAAA